MYFLLDNLKYVFVKSNATYHHFVPLKLMWLLKSPLDQNTIMIYDKFNGDFKSHINFKGTKWMICSITHLLMLKLNFGLLWAESNLRLFTLCYLGSNIFYKYLIYFGLSIYSTNMRGYYHSPSSFSTAHIFSWKRSTSSYDWFCFRIIYDLLDNIMVMPLTLTQITIRYIYIYIYIFVCVTYINNY